jgi:ribosomal protein S18 acetylase RimI-like enzyme
MTAAHYDAVLSLWQSTEGLGLDDSDSRPAVERFLTRNAGLSFVALDAAGRIVGAVLCGHDGRRGFLYHLAVARDCRGHGTGTELVCQALRQLAAAGISKCSIHVYQDNLPGQQFWLRSGWRRRGDILLMQTAVAALPTPEPSG